MSGRPICFKNIPPSPSFSFARLFLSYRLRARSRGVRSLLDRNRARFVRFVRAKRRVFDVFTSFVTSITHVVSRRVRTNLTNKTSFKERGGDVENAPEEEGHSFFNPPRGGDDDDDARGGTEDEEHQSPRLPRRISLSTTGENKRAVSRRSGVSPEYAPRSVRNDSASVRFASSSSVCVRVFLFFFEPHSRGALKAEMHHLCMHKQYIWDLGLNPRHEARTPLRTGLFPLKTRPLT